MKRRKQFGDHRRVLDLLVGVGGGVRHGRSAMGQARQRFHDQLRTLEDDIQELGDQAGRLLAMALRGGLSAGDVAVCDEVVRGDDEVDRRYLDVEQRIVSLFALQTPVACDLRLLTALLHINLHLERIADQAVNLAKITMAADGLPQNPQVLQGLGEMGTRALDMLGTAMQALAWRAWSWLTACPRWTMRSMS